LGGGRIVNTSDPSNADPLWAVDYRSGESVVRFEADGDMGGPEHHLTGVEMKPAIEYPESSKLPAINLPVTFEFGAIGMQWSALENQLGPSGIHHGIAEYQYPGTKSIKDSAGHFVNFDVSGFLRVRISGGKISAIVISHITTS
jgi:hypothetical protein